MSEINLRMERLALLIGTIVGQLSELLNIIKASDPSKDEIYKELLDIHQAAGLQIHELYYKYNSEKINDSNRI